MTLDTHTDLPEPVEFTAHERNEALRPVVGWAMRAAAERVSFTCDGATPDRDPGMGHWQSFQAEFDMDRLRSMGVNDLAWTLACETFSRTVELLLTGEVENHFFSENP